MAVEIALAWPAWTRALVLAAPAVGYPAPVRLVSRAIERLTRPAILRWSLPFGQRLAFCDPTRIECVRLRRQVAERLTQPDYGNFARAMVRSLGAVLGARPPLLQCVTQPTLLVWGRDDRMISVRRGQRLVSQLPNARLIELERCGHLPMLEQPEHFNQAVADFLATATTIRAGSCSAA